MSDVLNRDRNTADLLIELLKDKGLVAADQLDQAENLVVEVAQKIGLPEERIKNLRLLARYHDIGKVGVSDRIYFKPGSLTKYEYEEVKRHCEIGARIINTIPEIAHLSELILKHHETWDGTGYPRGLKREEIPVECRIFNICDAYVAMTSDRSYRNAMSFEKAARELKRCSGSQFDPIILEEFLQIVKRSN